MTTSNPKTTARVAFDIDPNLDKAIRLIAVNYGMSLRETYLVAVQTAFSGDVEYLDELIAKELVQKQGVKRKKFKPKKNKETISNEG